MSRFVGLSDLGFPLKMLLTCVACIDRGGGWGDAWIGGLDWGA